MSAEACRWLLHNTRGDLCRQSTARGRGSSGAALPRVSLTLSIAWFFRRGGNSPVPVIDAGARVDYRPNRERPPGQSATSHSTFFWMVVYLADRARAERGSKS